ncbi:cadmium transporter [Hymenobacter qilianensis]|uniref:Cadmium transporter n=2 Tax=Hymenobacter qilianensis TaxID=1385715 RepID=A0ACB5PX75_9BACT|nr:cadmium resistance transporter [Hymenobacter qilianensis]QNP54412.1 cadmium resistance transporter [Hymenobacter qilianensis]GGF80324.1 cadmium transporter [Hymenobacter qilianensis]
MDGLVGHLGLALLTFAVTNVDDLLLLGLFFSNPRYPARSVVIGQFLGVAFLVGISLVGLVLGKFGQPQWIGWLGLVPILIGLRAAWRLRDNSVVEVAPQAVSTGSTVLQVAAITIANGADNVSVYVPLFATLPAVVVGLYCGVFAAMVGVWCLVSYYLVQYPGLSRLLTRYGHVILPFFLMALGGWILYETKAYTLVLR